MDKKLVFATNNLHKLEEVRDILGNSLQILSLKDIGCSEDIPETAGTLEGNALLKSRYIKQNFGYDCFADDTGLEIKSLGNAPGVYSARYAGESKDPQANRSKVLREMENEEERSARFRTVIALALGDKEYLLEGLVNGTINREERGCTGFGYDSLFIPDGYTETFAELGTDIKNRISHRAEAIIKLKYFLEER